MQEQSACYKTNRSITLAVFARAELVLLFVDLLHQVDVRSRDDLSSRHYVSTVCAVEPFVPPVEGFRCFGRGEFAEVVDHVAG